METTKKPLLEAKNIFKAHESKWVLKDVSFTILPGQLIHLKGPNGAGKTTLLRIVAGELPPSSGEIEFDGQILGPGALEGRQNLSLVPEILLPSSWLNVREYLNFRAALRVDGEGKTMDIEPIIEEWQLGEFAKRPLGTLSHGERRRVVVAASMMTNPRLLLLDEPTVGIDAEQCKMLAERLKAFVAEGSAVLVASHIERQGLPEADCTYTLTDGGLTI